MEWRIWITWWIIFYIRYLRIFWIDIKKTLGKTVNPSVRIYIHKLQNRVTFKIKTRYYFELLTPETMKLPGSTNRKIRKNKNGKNVPYLEITEVVLIHCNVVNNSYQQKWRVLSTFVPNKSFGQLLDISPKYFIFLKILDAEFSYIEVWFADRNSYPLQISSAFPNVI